MTDAPVRHRRSGLYAPLVLFAIAVALWTGWWFFLTRQVEARVEAQAQTLRQAGWTVRWSELSTSGWPFRARVEADDFLIAPPSGHAVAAPVLVAEANAYNPDKWVAIAPDGLTLTRAGKGKVGVNGAALRLSVHGLTQRWPNVALELVDATFTTHRGAEPFPISRAGRLELYMRPHLAPASDQPGDDLDVMFRVVDAVGRRDGPVEGLAQEGRLTGQVEAVIEDAGALTGSDSAGVFAAWAEAGGRFSRVRATLEAGESRARLSSEALRADADGRLEGSLSVRAERPLPALAGLARSGGDAVSRTGAAGAAAANAATGGQGDVDLTVVFRDGRTYLGPFALAPAPKLF